MSVELADVPSAPSQTDESDNCPECGGDVVQFGGDELACSDCGLVLGEELMSRGPEWREFDEDREKRRASSLDPLKHDLGLSTKIGHGTDAKGNELDEKTRRKMNRLRKWNRRFRTRDAVDRVLKDGFGEIRRMASSLDLPRHVAEDAASLYRRVSDSGKMKGRSYESIASASVYAAARRQDVPRCLDAVVEVSRVSWNRVARAYRWMMREFDLEIEAAEPDDFLERIASDVDADREVVRLARDILDAVEFSPSGHEPKGVAGAALYAASVVLDGGLTQGDVSDAAGASLVTVRNRYQDLLDEYAREKKFDADDPRDLVNRISAVLRFRSGVRDRAVDVLDVMDDRDYFGRKEERVMAASAIELASVASRESTDRTTVSRQLLVDVFDVEKSSIWLRKSEMREVYEEERGIDLRLEGCREWVDWVVDKLGLADEVRDAAKRVCERIDDGSSGQRTVAAASVYISGVEAREDVSVSQIASVVGMTEGGVWYFISDLESEVEVDVDEYAGVRRLVGEFVEEIDAGEKVVDEAVDIVESVDFPEGCSSRMVAAVAVYAADEGVDGGCGYRRIADAACVSYTGVRRLFKNSFQRGEISVG